jgi:hypothetical protein
MICIQEVNLVLRVVTSAGSFALLGSVKVVLYNMLFHLHNALKFTPIVCTHAVKWAVLGSKNLQLFTRPQL